jgi:pyruvate dehydrogenase E1 component alpha subunit
VIFSNDPGVADPSNSPELIQLLNPDGERVEHPTVRPELDLAGVRAAYRDLVLIRRLDTEATALQRQGELGLWASLRGQEAAQVGSAHAMTRRDQAFPSYREHGVIFCRGVDPVTMLRLFRGVDQGSWDPAEHGVHLYAIVIGTQTLHATGYAMGIQRDGAVGTGDPDRDAAAIAYFGDGATAQGDVNEAFVFASVAQAPVVFFCQNNQFAISEPNERQMRVPPYRRAAGFGFPGVRVDGNDVLAVHAVTAAALRRARAGEGPTLIEAFTYRMGPHTTSDDPTRYRSAAEVAEWQRRDPIDRVRVLLSREDPACEGPDGWFARVDADADALAVRLRHECARMPDPEPITLFDHAYRDPHAQVEEQRRWWRDYEASFEPEPEVTR